MSGPRVTDTYTYHNADGSVNRCVDRIVPKGFRQWRPDENGEKIYNVTTVPEVLYRLPEVLETIAADLPVFVTEGEKDADSLVAIGKCGTTNPGGAGKWSLRYTETLRGAQVCIICDNDAAGAKHALTVACALDPVVKKLWIFQPKTPHKDVTEHLEAGLSLKELLPFDRAAAQETLGLPKKEQSSRRRSGVVSARDFCRRPSMNGNLQLLGPALNRTMRLTIGGLTGEGKTSIGCQMIRAVVYKEPFLLDTWGGRALAVDVEQGEETVKQRLRDYGLNDCADVDLLWEPDGLALDRDLDDRKYVEDILAKGRYDVVLFDPLYQLHCGNENEERTAADVMKVLDGWARKYEIAIIIPMHRRKPSPVAGLNTFTINDIGGHGAWVRNSEVVLGLQVVHAGRSWLRFFKDRPGFLPAIGTRWTLKFDPDTRQFEYMEEEEKGYKRTKELLTNAPGMTTAELADASDVKLGTIREHTKKIGAYSDDPDKALGEQRWSLEPWPNNQMVLGEVV